MTVTEKVKNYNGTNNFINSLQNGLKKYGRLTERQLMAAGKFFSNQKTQNEFKPLDVNINIKVKRTTAKRIANDNNLEFRPTLITVSKVLRKTDKAYQLVGRMTTGDVTSCRCCGADLTDWRSQATGVGPICAKSLNIPYVKNEGDVKVFRKLLQMKVNEVGDLTFWISKYQFNEGLEELMEVVK